MNVLLFFVLIGTASARTDYRRKCGTVHTGNDTFAIESIPQADSRLASPVRRIPVYFHVIHNSTTGNLSSSTIKKQIKVLNRDYSSAKIAFDLQNVTYLLSDTLFQFDYLRVGNPSYEIYKMRTGNAATLNIYSLQMKEPLGYLGIAQFPWKFKNYQQADGVLVHYNSLPGGNDPDYSLGRSATHEIGHWLGLLHTFEGGCSIKGDKINDTRPQFEPNYDCTPAKTTIQTCLLSDFRSSERKQAAIVLNQLPNDPVYNFMNYPPDRCMNNFTPLQIDRMNMFLKYRSSLDV